MSEEEAVAQEQPSGGMSLGDIYFILFRRKWIIVTFAILGACAAGVLFLIKPPRYRSEQKLFIRYVAEGKNPNPGENSAGASTRALNEKEASILSTETQIIQSLDVAREAAISVGPERILAKYGGGTNADWAADLILQNLEIEIMPQQGSVISLVFQHKEPDIAREVLKELVAAYIKRHKEMHQSVALFADFFVKETTRLRGDLARTEQQLREIKSAAGIISLDQSKKDYAEQIGRIREELLVEQANLGRYQAILDELPRMTANNNSSEPATNSELRVPLDQVNEYQSISLRLDTLMKKEQELLLEFKPSSEPVTRLRERIIEARAAKKKLEEQYPDLGMMRVVAPARSGQPLSPTLDLTTATIQVRGSKTTIDLLNGQLTQVQAEAAKVEEAESKIAELERTRLMQENDLKYFASSLEQSRIEGALGSGKAANIIPINSEPTGAAKAWSKTFRKKVQMIGIGGFMAGLALAFLIELFLDRSVKRPSDVTRKLRLPLFMSIPDISRNGHRPKGGKGGDGGQVLPDGSIGWPVANWDRNHPLRRFYEGLRDRLMIHFELNNVARKPKLVGVTSCGKGVGVSSIAAGLAASLSETGDGKVLLVDMTAEQGAAQQFHKGKLSCGLDDALEPETMKSALVQSNLYVAGETAGAGSRLPQVLPKHFAHLMPKLEASHYDYIIFDMPPVSATSMTTRLGRIMDMVLFVIESEKTGQDVAKQATALLVDSKVNVTAVLNRTHNYIPTRLHLEYLHDA